MGFGPTRGDPIGLAGRRLNRSAKVSLGISLTNSELEKHVRNIAAILKYHAHAGRRTRVTSMGGLYDAATLHALMSGLGSLPSRNELAKRVRACGPFFDLYGDLA